MVRKRRYQQPCPIARGLNHLGDRWALLILRDLHAGPARFGDLQTGLTGIATNLLSTRLQELQDSGLIRHRGPESGVRVYELTELGQGTELVIMALAEFGARMERDGETQPAGNLRLLCLPLKKLLQSAIRNNTPALPQPLSVELNLDGQPFALRLNQDRVSVQMRPAADANLRLKSTLQPAIELLDGRLGLLEFMREHTHVLAAQGLGMERVTSWIEQTPSL